MVIVWKVLDFELMQRHYLFQGGAKIKSAMKDKKAAKELISFSRQCLATVNLKTTSNRK